MKQTETTEKKSGTRVEEGLAGRRAVLLAEKGAVFLAEPGFELDSQGRGCSSYLLVLLPPSSHLAKIETCRK